VDEREEESDEEEPPTKDDPYNTDFGSTLGGTLQLGGAKGENIFGITNDRYKEFDDLDEDDREEEDKKDFSEYKSDIETCH
jgi:hypothetical protein